MSESYVKGDFSKLEKLVKALGTKKYVDIGVLEGIIHPNGKVTIAFIGAVNELGTDKAGRGNKTVIPARSFIKMPLETKSKEITKDVEKDFEKNLGNGDVDKILSRLGAACEKQIQLAFESGGFGTWDPNAESTIAAKKSSKPLIDIGALRKAISWQVGGE